MSLAVLISKDKSWYGCEDLPLARSDHTQIITFAKPFESKQYKQKSIKEITISHFFTTSNEIHRLDFYLNTQIA